jgi:hypothetical protein
MYRTITADKPLPVLLDTRRRRSTEQGEADDIVTLSGGLPFALAVIGRQLAARLV